MLLTSVLGTRSRPGTRPRTPDRPWAAAAFTFAAAGVVLVLPLVQLPFLVIEGTAGSLPLITGAVLAGAGCRLLLRPARARTTGVLVMAASLLSWFTATFGGLGIGMLLGVVGASLAIARRAPQPLPDAESA